MLTNSDSYQELVDRPRESLSIELKSWINPDSPEGIEKIVKAAIAMRNHNGGYILIGFHDATGEPDLENYPTDVRALFHVDKIQGMISRYASESFEIEIHFPTREGREFPVIKVGEGVKTPVATKSSLQNRDNKNVISENKVFVRSLKANNTPSTTEAIWKDWNRVVEICFDNREADIGRFIRRHLGGLSADLIQELAGAFVKGNSTQSTEEMLLSYLQQGKTRFDSVVAQRGLGLPDHGAWEVALIISGEVPPHSANSEFLNLLDASNPNYTGWPVWLDSRSFENESRPYVFEGAWEAFIYSYSHGNRWLNHLDFWRLDPAGQFYLRRALEDDIGGSARAPQPLTVLDFALVVLRVGESIAVGMEFARAMGCAPEGTQLAFGFRWTRLQNRELSSWAHPSRDLRPGRVAHQDEVFSHISIPLETPSSALAQYVHLATKPLFEVFSGFELTMEIAEELTRMLIERRL